MIIINTTTIVNNLGSLAKPLITQKWFYRKCRQRMDVGIALCRRLCLVEAAKTNNKLNK
jgi:hypothetical protein